MTIIELHPARVVKLILFTGIGILLFLAPIKFGMALGPSINGFPHTMLQWIMFSWPHWIWQISIVILAVIWLAGGISIGRLKIKYSSLDIFILLFLAASIISASNALCLHRAQHCLAQWFSYALTYFLVLSILENEKDLKYFLGVILVPAVFISLYSIYQYYIGLPETRQWAAQYMNAHSLEIIKGRLSSNRAFGTFIYPNTLAGYILLTMPLALAMFFIGFREHLRWWEGIIILSFLMILAGCVFTAHPGLIPFAYIAGCLYPLSMLYALFLTFSKGGWIALGFASLVLSVLIVRNRRILLKILLGITALASLFIIFGYRTSFFSKSEETFCRRWEYWTAGFRIIEEHPVIGVGPNNFGVIYPMYKLDTAEEVQNAHNNFLQTWAEEGILGFIAFCGIWLAAIKKAVYGIKNRKRRIYRMSLFGLLIGITAFAIHNLGDFDLYVPGLTVIAWAGLALLVWLSGAYKEKTLVIRSVGLRIIYLAIVLILGMGALLYLANGFSAEHYLIEARDALKKNNYALAEFGAKTGAALARNNPETYCLLADIYTSQRDYSKAVSYYKKAIKYNKYSSLYYYKMAVTYMRWMRYSGNKGLNKKIGSALNKAVELYPVNPFYHFQLGQFYESNGMYKKAGAEYNYCLKLNNKIKKAYENGKMLKRLILPEKVVKEIQRRLH